MSLTRRSVLAAAPVILRAQATSDELRVAVVGTGNRGSFLLKHLVTVPGVRVVAVCDIIQERAEKTAAVAGNARVWTDYRQMLDGQKDIDAVVVAAPDYTHKEIGMTVLEMGKHVYAEKPLALTAEHCKAVVNAAKQAKGIFQIGFQLRHDPHRKAAEDFIHSGAMGQVLLCHGMRHGGDLPRDIPWYFDKTKCGDILVDQGIHILDLFTWAIGSHPLRCYGSGGTILFVNDPPGRTVMDNYSIVYEYAGGVKVNFSHHYFDPPGFTGIQERVFAAQGAIDLQTATWSPRGRREKIQLEVPDAGKDSTYMSLAAFAGNVRNRREPVNNAMSALNSTLQALMGTRSIYEQRVVTWEEMTA
jgi:myo-inositol 2-dehydrogenase / D-chiro-inositol 1-dehydrogenase